MQREMEVREGARNAGEAAKANAGGEGGAVRWMR